MSSYYASLESDSEDEAVVVVPKETAKPKETKEVVPAGKNAKATTAKEVPKVVDKDNKSKATTAKGTAKVATPAVVPASVPEVEAVEDKKINQRGASDHGRLGKSGDQKIGAKNNSDKPPQRKERQNNTNRDPTKLNKKNGGGNYNQGSVKNECTEAEKDSYTTVEPVAEVDGTEAADDSAWPTDAADAAAVKEPVVVVPEPITFTLEEYMAKRNESRANSAIFGTLNKTSRESDFAGLSSKVDELPEAYYAAANAKDGKAKAGKSQRSTAKAQFTDVSFKSEKEEDTRGSGNGGRGGGRNGAPSPRGRGGGGRGGSRDNFSLDVEAFPTLN